MYTEFISKMPDPGLVYSGCFMTGSLSQGSEAGTLTPGPQDLCRQGGGPPPARTRVETLGKAHLRCFS